MTTTQTAQGGSKYDTPTMRALAAGIRAQVPTLLWGDPGVAKTATLTAAGAEWGFHVETVIGSIREASDFLGLPIENGGQVTYSSPSWVRRVNEADSAVLFLDELTTAPPSVQRAMLRILQEREVGETPLADTVSIVAAANDPEVAVDGWDLAAPVANRLMHIDWKMQTEAWLEGVLTDFKHAIYPSLTSMLADNVDVRQVQTRQLVTGFLKKNPNLLHKLPSNATEGGKGWPSPRSWTNAMNAMAHLRADDDAAILLVVEGCVGKGAATEFLAYVATADLVDPEVVLADPDAIDWKAERPDRLFTLVSSVTALAIIREDEQTWTDAMRVMISCAAADRPDVAMNATRALMNRKPAKARTPDGLQDAFRELFERGGRWGAKK